MKERRKMCIKNKTKKIMMALIGTAIFATGCQGATNADETSKIEVNITTTGKTEVPQETTTQAVQEETTDNSIPVSSQFDLNATRVDVPEDALIPGYDLSDAVFVGDSRTEGLTVYNVLTTSTVLATRGLMASSVLNEQFVDLGNGSKGTVVDYLKTHDFDKIYIMFGINELGCNINIFKTSYSMFVDEIREANPDIKIYAESIIPMVSDRTDDVYNNEIIATFNQALKEVCGEKNIQYLNVSAALIGDDGTLPEKYSRDGIHLNVEGLKRFVNYIIMSTYM